MDQDGSKNNNITNLNTDHKLVIQLVNLKKLDGKINKGIKERCEIKEDFF